MFAHIFTFPVIYSSYDKPWTHDLTGAVYKGKADTAPTDSFTEQATGDRKAC